MKNYVIRRILYSLLVVFGVMIICFVLFRFAAGDPSAMLLGKNPSPKEIEDLRDKLLSSKPLFFGWWRRTEAFSSLDFSSQQEIPHLQLIGDGIEKLEKHLKITPGCRIKLKRNFDTNTAKILIKADFDGDLNCGKTAFQKSIFGEHYLIVNSIHDELVFSSEKGCNLRAISFFKENPDPFDSQFFCSLGELLRFSQKFPYVVLFDFGRTLTTREKISDVLWRSMWVSLLLMLPVFIIENLISIPLAMFSAIYNGRLADRLITVFCVSGMSISYIVMIIFGQWFFSYYFGLFPIWGFEDARYLVLPVLIGVASGIGGSVRFYRTIFLNEMRKEYLRTVLSKGCSPWTIYFKHLLKNAGVPINTRISTVLPFLFTGSLLLESFFGIPGLGYEAINALNNSDLQMLKALVILTSIIFVSFNLLSDIVNSFLDPRIRLE